MNSNLLANYDEAASVIYLKKRERGFWRKLLNFHEVSIARKSLQIAGNPKSVLDVPCGTGRFWGMLSETPNRKIYACDFSEDMIKTAKNYRPTSIADRVIVFKASAFDIPQTKKSIENVFCMRFMHHITNHDQRLALLREFCRVASNSICVSLWIDGNYKFYRRKRKKTNKMDGWNRYVVPKVLIENEFRNAGLTIVGRLYFMRFYSMWCTYILNIG